MNLFMGTCSKYKENYYFMLWKNNHWSCKMRMDPICYLLAACCSMNKLEFNEK